MSQTKTPKKGQRIKLEIVSRVEHSAQVQSGIRVVETAYVFNDNSGPFFYGPGQPNEIGIAVALGLIAQGAVGLIKSAEQIGMSRPQNRDMWIKSIFDKIKEGLILTDSPITGNLDDV